VDSDGPHRRAEVYTYRTNPKNADTDADTQSDSDEVWAGMDPRTPVSYFRVTSQSVTNGGNRLVRWPAFTNRQYTLYRATNLVSGSKSRPSLAISPPTRRRTRTPTPSPLPPRVYRVGVQK